MFERFRRGSSTSSRFSCYGKLPFDREFLRYNLDSDEGRWIVSWVDGGHEAIAVKDESARRDSPLELRAILGRGKSVTAAMIRPSRDGGGRYYPVCVFTVLDAKPLRDQWHLAPLSVAPLWETMDREILSAKTPDRSSFAALLDQTTMHTDDPASLAGRFDEETRAPLKSPWSVLVGADGDGARQRATTLVSLGRAQAGARRASDGVALRVPIGPIPDSLRPASIAAAWVRLFTTVSGFRGPWPAVIEAHDREARRLTGIFIFGREPVEDDFAKLLAGVGDPAIDDLGEPWESEASGEGRDVVERLVGSGAGSLADLWGG